jgi:hypothetical protein
MSGYKDDPFEATLASNCFQFITHSEHFIIDKRSSVVYSFFTHPS